MLGSRACHCEEHCHLEYRSVSSVHLVLSEYVERCKYEYKMSLGLDVIQALQTQKKFHKMLW